VRAALERFRASFTYTLNPPLLGRDSIDDFLFSTQKGFCEHFASAFVVLMRAAGIPARVVTGFQGGTWNAAGGYLLVRNSDAHAWAEIWRPERGWVRVDPTAAVSPVRIELGAAAGVEPGAVAARDPRSARSRQRPLDASDHPLRCITAERHADAVRRA
jgi:transglutaminase-like putative cysteine protease